MRDIQQPDKPSNDIVMGARTEPYPPSFRLMDKKDSDGNIVGLFNNNGTLGWRKYAANIEIKVYHVSLLILSLS